MNNKDPIADGLESDIKNDPLHYKKLKDVSINGKAKLEQLLREGADETTVNEYKKVLEAYIIMEKFIDSLCKKT